MAEKQEYSIRWEISIDAESPEDAVRQVYNDYFKHDHSAQVFDVKPIDSDDSDYQMIDLEELDSPLED